jgi:hypothetical protein
MVDQANGIWKQAGVAMLISSKVDCKLKLGETKVTAY